MSNGSVLTARNGVATEGSACVDGMAAILCYRGDHRPSDRQDMAKKSIDSVGSEPDAAAAADRKKIEAYLSSEAWETRLAEARARRAEVLSARRAAGRPAICPMPVPSGQPGFTTAPLRPQTPDACQGPAADGTAGAAIASNGEHQSRRAAIGVIGLIAVIAVVAAAWPILRPLSESVFGRSGIPDPAVELPGLAEFGADGEAAPSAAAPRFEERRVAEAPSPALPVLAGPTDAPALSGAENGASLTRSIPDFPPPPSTDRNTAPSGFATRSGAELEMPIPSTVARPGSDEATGMAALTLPGLAIDDPVFPVRAAERAAPEVRVPPAGFDLAVAAPGRLPLPDVEGMATSGIAAPRRPATVEPYVPLSPSDGAAERAVAASMDTPAGSRDVAALQVVAPDWPGSGAELTLDGLVESRDPESVAARLALSRSLPSMPLRPQSGSAAPSALPAIGAPRLSAIGPDFSAADSGEEAPTPPAPEAETFAAPLPHRPSPPASDGDVATLGQSAVANAARYRLTLHAGAEDMAAALHNRLIAIGFTTIDVTISPLAGSSTSVFYFHGEDASAAAQLADLLGGEAVSAVGIVPSPAVGALDIHVGG